MTQIALDHENRMRDMSDQPRIRPLYALPALTVLTGLIAGILIDWHWAPALWLYPTLLCLGLAAAALSAVAHSRLPRRIGRFALPLAVGLVSLALGGFRHADDDRRIPPHHILNFTDEELIAAHVRGTARSSPAESRPPDHKFARWLPHPPKSSFLIAVKEIRTKSGWNPCTGRVRLNVKEPVTGVNPGDRIEVYGRLARLQSAANPGQYDTRRQYWRSGVYASLSVDHLESLRVGNGTRDGFFIRLQSRLRAWAADLLMDDLPDDDETCGLLSTLVLGQRNAVHRSLNDSFVRTGTAHVLAVSGLHVGMIAAILLVAARLLTLSPRQAMAFSTLIIIAYMVVAEPRPPILRAGVMAMFLAIATFTLRPSQGVLWLPLAAVVLLIARPVWLFDPSMQLSFIVVAGVMHLTPAVARLFHKVRNRALRRPPEGHPLAPIFQEQDRRWQAENPFRSRVLIGLGWTAAVSVAAWLTCLPIAAYHFGQLSLLGWFSSLILCPIVFLILLVAGVKMSVAVLFPAPAACLTPVMTFLTDLLTTMVRFLERWPGMYLPIFPPPWVLVAGCYGLLAIWAWNPNLVRSFRRRTGLATLLLAATIVAYWPVRMHRDDLSVTCLAVGNGSATLIQTPDGGSFLYDAGTLENFDVGRSVIVPAARALGIRRIDAAFISHPNLDHFNGLPSVRETFGIHDLYLTPHFETLSPAGPARELLDYLPTVGVPRHEITTDTPLDFGRVDAAVLWPPATPPFDLDANKSSLVLKLSYGGRSILLCGDIEQKAQEALLHHPDLHADVLVLPHHGAVVRNTAEFVRAVAPRVLIRSSGHPDEHSGSRLLALTADYAYYNTAEHGAVTVRLSPAAREITPYRTPHPGAKHNAP